MKRKAKATAVIRRSIALPRALVDEVSSVAPAAMRHNFNRLVTVALHEFVAAERARAFAREMQDMASDPQIQTECRTIDHEFTRAALDGLDRGKAR